MSARKRFMEPYSIQPAVTFNDRVAHRLMELEGLNYSYKAIHQREDYSVRPSGRVIVSFKENNGTYTKEYGDNTAVANEYGSEYMAEKNLKEILVPEYIERTMGLFPNYNSFSEGLKIELIQSVFRGWVSPKTKGYIDKGDYALAAVEFLDNKEYDDAAAGITNNAGIVPRMQALSDALIKESGM